MNTKTRKIVVADYYDKERRATVVARYNVDGRLYINHRQYRAALSRAKVMDGSCLAIPRDVESSIDVFDNSGHWVGEISHYY